MSEKDTLKVQKKRAKAETKAAKKAPRVKGSGGQEIPERHEEREPERSDSLAEKNLALTRWKVIFTGLSVLIALVSLIVVLLRS